MKMSVSVKKFYRNLFFSHVEALDYAKTWIEIYKRDGDKVLKRLEDNREHAIKIEKKYGLNRN